MVSLLYRMPYSYCSLFISGSHLGVHRRRQTAGNSIIFRLLLDLKPCARTVLHFQMLIWAGLLDFSASVTRAGSCAEQSRLRTSDYEYSTVMSISVLSRLYTPLPCILIRSSFGFNRMPENIGVISPASAAIAPISFPRFALVRSLLQSQLSSPLYLSPCC